MAHSDVLIFLTNITWMFFIFLFLYFFFVLFFLPSFYKKLRLFLVTRAELLFLGVHFSSLLPAGTANGLFFLREFKSVFYVFCGLIVGLLNFGVSLSLGKVFFVFNDLLVAPVLFGVYLVEGFTTNLSFLANSNDGYFFSVFRCI